MSSQRKLKLLCFSLGDRIFALEIMGVREILRLQSITRIPNAPDTVMGVINVRGELFSLLDLRKVFSVEAEPAPDRDKRIIIGGRKSHRFGMMVDSVMEVVTLDVEGIDPAPSGSGKGPVLGIFKRPGDEKGCIVILLRTSALGLLAHGEYTGTVEELAKLPEALEPSAAEKPGVASPPGGEP